MDFILNNQIIVWHAFLILSKLIIVIIIFKNYLLIIIIFRKRLSLSLFLPFYTFFVIKS